MIYTSYFAQLKNLPPNIIPISICGSAPKWYTGLQYKKLAPKYNFFMKWKENHDNDYYTRCFKEQVLSSLDPDKVLAELFSKVSKDQTFALICYEKPQDFCHRHLIADWLNESGLIHCEEWKPT